MRIACVVAFAITSASAVLRGQGAGPDSVDLVRLAESFRLARATASTIWPGWEATPFPVVLVGSEREFLVGHPNPPSGFTDLGPSAILQARVWSRPRQFQPNLLATFPAFGPPSVVVVGRAEATRKTSTAWALTVLHEHFHQYQSAGADYYAAVEQLGLSGGDQTGMWMLNYPFPYRSPDVATTFAAVSRQLGRVLERSTAAERREFWTAYRTFLSGLSERDRRYLSFQVWQEGVARYVELRAAEVASRDYEPSQAFRKLPDFASYSTAAGELRRAILAELVRPDLAAQQRVSFYAFGAGLALLLDEDAPGWKARYSKERFALEAYLP